MRLKLPFFALAITSLALAFWHPYVRNYKPNFGSKADYAMVWLDK